ncbi:hypothetical protein OKW21_006364 [Catalinimonas alkaloidigena]|uniref:prenyltransferase/squalene oxidase repeat-containing protein n=1 Tax=Catalinimonas alkaloidigena TaxID=1075417 RepID=UPI0024052494|nr:prenyltransferase/squalene oxidase repeat-containing protein [Catalinimonas alkaloidigena]MDF9801101.1 hypothetical protein [Catalinimonas alkaloidigena]
MKYNPEKFVSNLYSKTPAGFASVPGGRVTLYGTCYGLLTQYYLDDSIKLDPDVEKFILSCQNPDSGLFEGPEFSKEYFESRIHDVEHISLHLLCTVLPVLQQFGVKPHYSIKAVHKFCNLPYLQKWLNDREWKKAWLEGNNILFVGQTLVYLRDEEKLPQAQAALDLWFEWLDREIDPSTGLWGTNGYCSPFHAMCGGYHQLLVYYYERHPIQYPKQLVDTVLALQHVDGGFSPSGGGGACEDVDAVDILVNLYKINNYKRPHIRNALRKNLKHILSLQNPDGGFPYKRNAPQSHMGIQDTIAPPNASTMFATWFRVHTIALIAEILTDEKSLAELSLNFSKGLSMGWHSPWDKEQKILGLTQKINEWVVSQQLHLQHNAHNFNKRLRNKAKRVRELIKR